MFTGLIQRCGSISKRSGLTLEIEVENIWQDLAFGESIAVNGTCLTLERVNGNTLIFHTLTETLKRTNLGVLPLHSQVNLERALRLGSPLDGHLVTGHIDAAAQVRNWAQRPGGDMELTVELPSSLQKLVAEKGSIAIDGVSLTVVAVRENEFTVELIPVTREHTALGSRKIGCPVNLEADLIARYVARHLTTGQDNNSNVTMQKLFAAGFVK